MTRARAWPLVSSNSNSSSNASASSNPVAQSIIAFAKVSAGRGFVCGLQAGGAVLFCWPSTPAPQWG